MQCNVIINSSLLEVATSSDECEVFGFGSLHHLPGERPSRGPLFCAPARLRSSLSCFLPSSASSTTTRGAPARNSSCVTRGSAPRPSARRRPPPGRERAVADAHPRAASRGKTAQWGGATQTAATVTAPPALTTQTWRSRRRHRGRGAGRREMPSSRPPPPLPLPFRPACSRARCRDELCHGAASVSKRRRRTRTARCFGGNAISLSLRFVRLPASSLSPPFFLYSCSPLASRTAARARARAPRFAVCSARALCVRDVAMRLSARALLRRSPRPPRTRAAGGACLF